MLVLILVGSFVVVLGLTIWYIASGRTKIQIVNKVVADADMNLFHIFGHSIHMPEDGPSFEIYRHFVFDTANNKFTAGAHQQGTGIDLESPFVERSLQTLSEKMGKELKLAPDKEIRSDMKVIRRDLNTTDTEVIEKIPNDAFVVTKLRENEMGFSKVRLEIYRGGINIRRHEFKGWAEHDFGIYKTSFSNQVILTYAKGWMNYAVSLVVIDLSTGEFLFEQYISAK